MKRADAAIVRALMAAKPSDIERSDVHLAAQTYETAAVACRREHPEILNPPCRECIVATFATLVMFFGQMVKAARAEP